MKPRILSVSLAHRPLFVGKLKVPLPNRRPPSISGLRNHAWQFPAMRMARILSPKTPLNGRPVLMPGCKDSLTNYTCTVDHLESTLDKVHSSSMTPIKWTRSEDKSSHYKYLAIFLNQCVQASHAGLDADPNFAVKKAQRWYADLQFIVVKPPILDKSKNPTPSLAGVLNLKAGDAVCWSPQSLDNPSESLHIPVQVGKGWLSIVNQALKYARRLFDANPLRRFALVIGFDYIERELRFLVFHRGGLTSSLALSVKTDTKNILRLFVAILSWSSPADAGFPEWCNNTQFLLPWNCDDTESALFTIDTILHDSTTVRGRAARAIQVSYDTNASSTKPTSLLSTVPVPLTFVHHPLLLSSNLPKTSTDVKLVLKSTWTKDDGQNIESRLLQSCNGQFGLPTHYYSFPAYQKNQPITNHLFLPENGNEAKEYHFKLSLKKVPSPEYRSLQIHVTSYVGHSLVTAKTPWDLFVAIGHAMLGWLSMCQMDFQHRDISIGNVLMLDKAVKTLNFKVQRYEADLPALKDESKNELVRLLLKQMSMDRTSNIALEIEQHLGDLGIHELCTGFVIDGDMAVDWKSYFTSPHYGSTAGTPRFMSPELLSESHHPYLQSPMDDLSSFYYVGQWAAAYNDESGKIGSNIREIRDLLPAGRDSRENATSLIRKIVETDISLYGPFLTRSAPFLREWHSSLLELRHTWNVIESQALIEGLTGKEAHDFFVPQFHQFALRGVLLYLRLLVKHRDELQRPM